MCTAGKALRHLKSQHGTVGVRCTTTRFSSSKEGRCAKNKHNRTVDMLEDTPPIASSLYYKDTNKISLTSLSVPFQQMGLRMKENDGCQYKRTGVGWSGLE